MHHAVWFTPWGWIYKPRSWQGWAIAFLAIAFCFNVFVAIDRYSESVSDTFYAIFPYFVSAAAVYLWIASHTSPKA